jgi:hypothetical protein
MKIKWLPVLILNLFVSRGLTGWSDLKHVVCLSDGLELDLFLRGVIDWL